MFIWLYVIKNKLCLFKTELSVYLETVVIDKIKQVVQWIWRSYDVHCVWLVANLTLLSYLSCKSYFCELQPFGSCVTTEFYDLLCDFETWHWYIRNIDEKTCITIFSLTFEVSAYTYDESILHTLSWMIQESLCDVKMCIYFPERMLCWTVHWIGK